jgi:hypothetical protein
MHLNGALHQPSTRMNLNRTLNGRHYYACGAGASAAAEIPVSNLQKCCLQNVSKLQNCVVLFEAIISIVYTNLNSNTPSPYPHGDGAYSAAEMQCIFVYKYKYGAGACAAAAI